MYHLASRVMRPLSPALRWALPMYRQRIASTCSRRGRGDDECFARRMHIDPPKCQPRHRVGLRNVVRRLECAVAILDHRMRHAVLPGPPKLTELGCCPAHWIADVRIPRWVEQ